MDIYLVGTSYIKKSTQQLILNIKNRFYLKNPLGNI